MSDATEIVPSDNEQDDEAFVAGILEQIRRDERRARVVRSLVIVCGLMLAWACGAAWATYALGGM